MMSPGTVDSGPVALGNESTSTKRGRPANTPTLDRLESARPSLRRDLSDDDVSLDHSEVAHLRLSLRPSGVVGPWFHHDADPTGHQYPSELGQHLLGIAHVMKGVVAGHPIHQGVIEVDPVAIEGQEHRFVTKRR